MTRFTMLVFLGWLAGCVTDPQPIPIPSPDPQTMHLSASVSRKATLAGLPDTAQWREGIEIVVANLDQETTERAAVSEDGSFVLEVSWVWDDVTKESLEAWLERGEERSEAVPIKTPPPNLPADMKAPSVIGSITPSGTSTVRVAGSMAGTNKLAVVGNNTQGHVVSTMTTSGGEYEVIIEAATGDEIVVFIVDGASNKNSPRTMALVP